MIRATIIIPMKFLKFSFDTPLFYIYGSIITCGAIFEEKKKRTNYIKWHVVIMIVDHELTKFGRTGTPFMPRALD